VWVSRACILLMALLAGITALFIQTIADVWQFLVALGAGLGSVTAARWYWARVTPWAEFAAIFVTTAAAITLQGFFSPRLFGSDNTWMIAEVPAWLQIVLIAGLSLAAWIPVAIFGPKNSTDALKIFAERVQPIGWGWPTIQQQQEPL